MRGLILISCLLLQSSALSAEFSGGTGEPDDPYQIATTSDLILLGESPEDYNKHFILTADIDLDPNLPGRKIFEKAVIAPDANTVELYFQGTPFTGVFNGNGHTISHLTLTGSRYLGLFGRLGTGSNISNLGLVAADVDGSGYCVGGLVAENYHGSVISCYSTGVVDGSGGIGGLVGINSGSMTACYSICVVSGSFDVGGLVGENNGNIAMSYSTGKVTDKIKGTKWDTGGLVGDNDDGDIVLIFWNVETSGQATSADGTGLTTNEMQDLNTFLNAGWDFVDETFNGTSDYWQILSGDYPRLRSHSGDSPAMPEGLGTAQQPYLIRDARDLGTMWIKPMAHYRLEASVDLSEIKWSMAVVPWFKGTFDGNGYVISNLHIEGHKYLGLFGKLDSGVIISNLGLDTVDINGTADYVGGLVGYNYKGCIVTSFSTGTISGDCYVGGLVGNNEYGSTTSCYSTAIIIGDVNVGGLVGHNRHGIIDTSFSTGTISGDDNVGGLVGYNDIGSIISSYSTGTISGGDMYAGGLVGLNSGSMTACYSNCEVSGYSYVGGLAGRNEGNIVISYSTGKVTGIGWDAGGLVGYNYYGGITSCFWDVETSGQDTSDGGTGLTTADMQDIITFLNAGWDFIGETINGTCDYWQISPDDYPQLRNHTGDRPVMPEGLGTAQNPYLIRDAGDLSTVWNRPTAHYRLEESVDLSGIKWSTAVIPWFEGIFDGNGHVISNLHIQGGEFQGLFGQLGSGAIISNLGLDAVDVNGTADYVSGLVGYNYKGNITTSFSAGTVSGRNYVGGLVGYNDHGNITSCSSTGTISGHDNVGGLVGQNFYGSINTSTSSGTVSGDDNVGGLVGPNLSGSIDTCSSTSTVDGDDYVGGLSGYNEYGSIISSYSMGKVTGTNDVGGHVGLNRSNIISCYSTGSVTGTGENVGGLVGNSYWYYAVITTSCSKGEVSGNTNVGGLVGKIRHSDIISSYSTGKVTGNQSVGGLVGLNWGEITTSYSTGAVRGDSEVGGLIGSGSGADTCFWDTQTSGQTTSRGGVGKTTAEMQTASTFLEADWYFVGGAGRGKEGIWWILEGQDYPRLWWEAAEQ